MSRFEVFTGPPGKSVLIGLVDAVSSQEAIEALARRLSERLGIARPVRVLAAGAWDVLAWLRPDGSGSVFFPGGAAGRAAGMVLTLAQCVVCVLIIRYLRTEEIRSLFLRRTDPSGP